MTGVLKDLPFAMAYLDDIIIYSSTPEEHLEHIKMVFEKLHDAKLSMKLSKCHFFTKEIQYLRHILGKEGIKPVPAKTEAIKVMHPPVNPKQVCTFLGLVGYYRKFIRNFAKIAKPLTMLTCMDVKFEWKDTHQDAFMKLKEAIIQAPIPAKTEAIKVMHPPVNPKQVCTFLGLVGYYRKFIRNFAKIAKPLTMLTCMDVKFEWKDTHQDAFMKLKEAIIQAPILRYPDTTKHYIVYTDASDDACRVQLSQIHDKTKFPVAFLSHTFTDTQRRWSTPEQEAYGIYFAIKKWNNYLQGADIIVRNDHKSLARFLNGKNKNTKINRWGLELTSYNVTFEWISGARNKAADCLSRLEELPKKHQKNQTRTKFTRINMVRAVTTRSRSRQPEIDKETEKPQPKETN